VSDAKVSYRQGGSNRLSYVGHSNKNWKPIFSVYNYKWRSFCHWRIAREFGPRVSSVYKHALSCFIQDGQTL